MRRPWVRWWGMVALLTVYLTANVAWFTYSLGSWLDSHAANTVNASYQVDGVDVLNHVTAAMWWQVVANGLLLLVLRRTRKVGAALLLSAVVLIATLLAIVWSFAGDMN